MADEIDDLVENLKIASISNDPLVNSNTESTAQLLYKICAIKDPKLFDKHDVALDLIALIEHKNDDIRKEAAKCIAEITKSEVQRKKFTTAIVIQTFLSCLSNLKNVHNMELPIQICRALGNICYLNDEARDLILKVNGDIILIQLLDIIEIPDQENALQFVKVRGGLISNYLLGGETVAISAMKANILHKLQDIITHCVENIDTEHNEDVLLNTLPILSILSENVADLNFDKKLNLQLSRILAISSNPDLAEMCFELLHYQTENDDVKLLLAKDGLCETIYNLLEKYKNFANTSESRALMKLACELIVSILTGDESMNYLYNTTLLQKMEDWLDSTDKDLLTTGVLALGNFARTDSHCISMVEGAIMHKLVRVLAKHNNVEDDVRLQHALLSTLRNLVIPKPNKPAVIKAGLVETILPMLHIHQPLVVFKLLGTLRMTVDGQEKLARELLQNRPLVEQLVIWSRSSDYAGVTGESLRLLAWLVKHAFWTRIAFTVLNQTKVQSGKLSADITTLNYTDGDCLRIFIMQEGTVQSIINMLTSQHLVMQNEALIALCILSLLFLVHYQSETEMSTDYFKTAEHLQDTYIKNEVGKHLSELIIKSSETMSKEIVENLQHFVNLLKSSKKLEAHLNQFNIDELLKSIPILTEYCTL